MVARPIQAAFTSAIAFFIGGGVPILTIIIAPTNYLIPIVAATSITLLALLGAFGARVGGASLYKGAARVTFWGVLAMGLTAIIGAVTGVSI